jgi:hypothetical protein
MRGEERLERDAEERRPRRRARLETGLALALLLASSAAGAAGAERPDLEYPQLAPSLPEPAPQPALSAPAEIDPATTPAPSELRLLWFDPKDLFPGFGVVSKEVTRMFRRVGVDVRFERGDVGVNFGDGGTLDIPIIVLDHDPMPSRSSRMVMGLVPRPPDGPRVVWVFLSNIRWTLGQDPRMPRITPQQGSALGVALSRVVAHEVIHAIAPDEPHAASGLMHHSMDRSFLLGRKASIDAECARTFARHLGELLRGPATHQPALIGADGAASLP